MMSANKRFGRYQIRGIPMSKSPEAFRTISEVAEWLEIQAHVLRFWESRFNQVKPVKRAGGRRYYRPSDMLLLGGIQHLMHDKGMSIKDTQAMIREQGVQAIQAMSRPLEGEEAVAPKPEAQDSVWDNRPRTNPETVAAAQSDPEPESEPNPTPAEPTDEPETERTPATPVAGFEASPTSEPALAPASEPAPVSPLEPASPPVSERSVDSEPTAVPDPSIEAAPAIVSETEPSFAAPSAPSASAPETPVAQKSLQTRTNDSAAHSSTLPAESVSGLSPQDATPPAASPTTAAAPDTPVASPSPAPAPRATSAPTQSAVQPRATAPTASAEVATQSPIAPAQPQSLRPQSTPAVPIDATTAAVGAQQQTAQKPPVTAPQHADIPRPEDEPLFAASDKVEIAPSAPQAVTVSSPEPVTAAAPQQMPLASPYARTDTAPPAISAQVETGATQPQNAPAPNAVVAQAGSQPTTLERPVASPTPEADRLVAPQSHAAHSAEQTAPSTRPPKAQGTAQMDMPMDMPNAAAPEPPAAPHSSASAPAGSVASFESQQDFFEGAELDVHLIDDEAEPVDGLPAGAIPPPPTEPSVKMAGSQPVAPDASVLPQPEATFESVIASDAKNLECEAAQQPTETKEAVDTTETVDLTSSEPSLMEFKKVPVPTADPEGSDNDPPLSAEPAQVLAPTALVEEPVPNINFDASADAVNEDDVQEDLAGSPAEGDHTTQITERGHELPPPQKNLVEETMATTPGLLGHLSARFPEDESKRAILVDVLRALTAWQPRP